MVLLNLGVLYLDTDQPAQALPPLREALEAAELLGLLGMQGVLRIRLAEATVRLNQPDAWQQAQHALRELHQAGDPLHIALGTCFAGQIAARLGMTDDARRCLEQSETALSTLEMPPTSMLRANIAALRSLLKG